jgi:hypothetical protein
MPSARSERVVAPCGSVLEHLPVRPRPFRAFRCGFAKLKAVSGDSGDEWLVEPDWHHQGRRSTEGYARRAHRAAQVAIVTGGLEGHNPLPQVEGGGQDALSSV